MSGIPNVSERVWSLDVYLPGRPTIRSAVRACPVDARKQNDCVGWLTDPQKPYGCAGLTVATVALGALVVALVIGAVLMFAGRGT